jgi:hypothetical protein
MTNKIDLTRISLISAGLLAATIMFAPCAQSVAQERSATSTDFSAQQQQDKDKKKAAPAARTAPRTVTQPKATSRVVRQPATSRTITQTKATSHVVKQPKATSRVVKQPKATRKVVAPAAAGRKVVSPVTAPRVVTPKGKRTITASRLRGVPTSGVRRAVISGHNYSAWRSGHRVRHRSGWRTFVALSALGAIAIGSSEYYPYAYISAPENYCEGLTEDGCELMWQDVETIEGDIIPQCVAYCPWQ